MTSAENSVLEPPNLKIFWGRRPPDPPPPPTNARASLYKKPGYGPGSNIGNHAWTNNHLIDFENARVMDKEVTIACGKFLTREDQRALLRFY